MMMVCGIDVGLSGALCFMNAVGECVATIEDIPTFSLSRNGKSKRDIDAHRLAEIIPQIGHAFIEQVGAMPGQGVSGVFAFGKTYGVIIGVLAARGVPMTFVAPRKWKADLSVPAAKDGARARASQLLPHAAHLWPLVKHDGRAEAALICLWGVRALTAIAPLGQRQQPTPAYDPARDSLESYNAAVQEIGRRVKAGEEPPPSTGWFGSGE